MQWVSIFYTWRQALSGLEVENQFFVYFFGGPVRHICRPEVENHLARCLTGMSHSTECPQSLIVGRNIVQLSTELLHCRKRLTELLCLLTPEQYLLCTFWGVEYGVGLNSL